ncbi:MAG: LysR family transcriptional regulator substrate-binding protein, partial [Pseudomonadota bacterium]
FDVGYHSELTVVTRAPCPVVLAAPAGHPILRTAGPIRMEDLAQARVALLHATSGLRRLVKAAEEEAGVHLSFALRSNSVHVLINYVCCGLGVALVPASAVVGGDMRERYGIEIRSIESRALQGAEVSLFVRRGRTLGAGSRLMLESISRHIHEILV